MKKKSAFILGLLFLSIQSFAQTVSDIDGNTYNTITLGTQIWMKENLKTTHFSNGDLIPTTTLAIANDTTSIYQWSYNNDTLNISTYGRLYTWFVVNDTRKACPSGWHIPNEEEWTRLATFLGGDTIAGNKMKETGTSHWSSTNIAVTNSSNFTAIPGGFRGNPSGFSNIYTIANFWTSSPWGSSSFQRAIRYELKSNSAALEQSVAVANCGLSIRCIKDVAANIENTLPKNKVNIFPNPTKDILNIISEETGNYTVSIYNIQGSLVLEKSLKNGISTLKLDTLPKGVYVLKINDSNAIIEQKIIIE